MSSMTDDVLKRFEQEPRYLVFRPQPVLECVLSLIPLPRKGLEVGNATVNNEVCRWLDLVQRLVHTLRVREQYQESGATGVV